MTDIIAHDDLQFGEFDTDFIPQLFEGCDEEDQAIAGEKFKEHIQKAAQRQWETLKNDENELNQDLQKTETLAASVNKSLQELNDRIKKVEDSKKRFQVGNADAEKAALIDQKNTKDGELKELKEAAKGQFESMGKELKAIDQNALKKMKAFLAKQQDTHLTYILDNLCKFIKGDKNATYSAEFKCFDNVEVLHDKVREVKIGKLNYKDIEKVIIHIQGKDGSSDMISKMVDDNKTYAPFFCYLKTLIKLCNWSMTASKVEQHTKKIEVLNRGINDQEAMRQRNKDILKTLAELDQLKEMKAFLENTELGIINNKKERVNAALDAVRSKINNFVENFFKEEAAPEEEE